MMPAELDIPTFDELERLLGAADLVVPRSVLAELERLSSETGPEAAAAAVGKQLAEEHCRPIGSGDHDADPEITTLASAGDVDYVVTNDTPLRRQVLDEGIPVISLRGRTKLAVIRP